MGRRPPRRRPHDGRVPVVGDEDALAPDGVVGDHGGLGQAIGDHLGPDPLAEELPEPVAGPAVLAEPDPAELEAPVDPPPVGPGQRSHPVQQPPGRPAGRRGPSSGPRSWGAAGRWSPRPPRRPPAARTGWRWPRCPTTATCLPPRSTEWSQRAECQVGPGELVEPLEFGDVGPVELSAGEDHGVGLEHLGAPPARSRSIRHAADRPRRRVDPAHRGAEAEVGPEA